MPTLYLLVAAAVVAALSGWGGYSHGVDVERGRQAVEHQAAVVAAADAARRDAASEAERRSEAALLDARRAASAREVRLKGQINALSTARPDCGLPESRRVLINAAVAIANGGTADAPNSLPAAVPAAAPAR